MTSHAFAPDEHLCTRDTGLSLARKWRFKCFPEVLRRSARRVRSNGYAFQIEMTFRLEEGIPDANRSFFMTTEGESKCRSIVARPS